jgi:hypothetical protein
MGLEVVGDDYNFETHNSNSGKWKNQQYPNKDLNEVIPTAPVSVVDGIADITSGNSIVSTLNRIRVSGQTNNTTSNSSVQNFPYLRLVGTPQNINNTGQSGDVSYDDNYFYIFTNDHWKRVAISSFS